MRGHKTQLGFGLQANSLPPYAISTKPTSAPGTPTFRHTMWSGSPRLFFVAAFVLNILLWSQSRYAQLTHSTGASLAKRGLVTNSYFPASTSSYSNWTSLEEEEEVRAD